MAMRGSRLISCAQDRLSRQGPRLFPKISLLEGIHCRHEGQQVDVLAQDLMGLEPMVHRPLYRWGCRCHALDEIRLKRDAVVLIACSKDHVLV